MSHKKSGGYSGRDAIDQTLKQALRKLPQVPFVQQTEHYIDDVLFRLDVLGQLCAEAHAAMKAAQMDPAVFEMDDVSLTRFMTTDHLDDEEAMFNGVHFLWRNDGETVRVATSVTAGPESMQYMCFAEVFRINEGDDQWQVLGDDGWEDDGPPAMLFDLLEDIWDEDVDGDEWSEDRTIAQLDISVDAYNALEAAGIETIDDLAMMREKTLRALVGDEMLDDIRQALSAFEIELE